MLSHLRPNQLNQFSNVLQGANVFDPELDPERFFDRDNHVDIRQRIPSCNVLGGHAFADDEGVVAKDIPKNRGQPRLDFLTLHSDPHYNSLTTGVMKTL